MSEDPTIRYLKEPTSGATAPAAAVAAESLGSERAGDSIGPYRLIEVLGEGGFGIVWRAEQLQPVQREVALKVIKPGMDTREVIARFEAERQAVALMDHPNIARMFEGGATPGGRPYFAMEYIKGLPVTEFCDARRLSLDARISIFTDVCSAVQHAHQKAILHRDLKPSNILVIEDGGRFVPKVIDFGIAKALGTHLTEKTLVTRADLAIGTPQYMSPEQAGVEDLDVDTRSDVYSLGVILYELLTGSTPLRKDELRKLLFNQLQQIMLTRDPERPSTRLQHLEQATQQQVAQQRQMDTLHLRKQLRGDLDWIVMRAIERDRNRRYQTVNALALDLQRYTRGDAVEAGPPSASYRLGKLAKRYRGALAAVAVVLASILVGLGFTIWQAVRATQAEKLASQRLGEAQAARDAAESLTSEAIVGLRKKLMDVGKAGLLEDMVKAADEYYEKLPASLHSTESERHRASLYINRVAIAGALGRHDEQEKYAHEALRLIGKLLKSLPDDESLHEEAAFVTLGLCYLYHERGDTTRLFKTADQVAISCNAWVKTHPKSAWAFRYQVMAHNMVSYWLFHGLNQPLQAMIRVQIAAKITQDFRAAFGETSEVLECEGLMRYGQATLATRTGQPESGTADFEAAARDFARAMELGNDSVILRTFYASALLNAGGGIHKRGFAKNDPAEQKRGEEMVLKSLEIRTHLVATEPGHAEWWRDVAWSHSKLAEMARDKKDAAGELKHYEESLRYREEAVKRQPTRGLFLHERAVNRFWLANALLKQSPPDFDRAAESSITALEDWRRSLEASNMRPAWSYQVKADVSRIVSIANSRDPAVALDLLTRASACLEPLHGKVQGKNDVTASLVLLLTAQRDTLTALGRTADTAAVVRKLDELKSGKNTTAEGELEVARLLIDGATSQLDNLGKITEKDVPAALAKIETDIARSRALLMPLVARDGSPDNRALLAGNWKQQARLCKAQTKRPAAADAYEKAIALLDAPVNLAARSDAQFDLAELLRDMKEFARARDLYATAAKARDSLSGSTSASGSPFYRASQAWSSLAGVQWSLGDAAATRASYEATLQRARSAVKAEPGKSAYHWNVLQQLAVQARFLSAEKDFVALKDNVASLAAGLRKVLPAETDSTRLKNFNYHANDAFLKTRDAGAFDLALQILDAVIELRQRLETIDGWPADPAISSISALLSRASLLADQKKSDESGAAYVAALAAAERSARPDIIAEVNSRLRSLYDTQGKLEEAERHARAAHEMTKKTDLGHRTVNLAGDLAAVLAKRKQFEEAEKVALAAWDAASTRTWPGEPLKLRHDHAGRICELYRLWSAAAPDETWSRQSKDWRLRQAQALQPDATLSDSDFNLVLLPWMFQMACWVEEGKADEFKRERARLIPLAAARKQPDAWQRVAKTALLLPAEGGDLAGIARLADESFKATPPQSVNYEWACIAQGLALARTDKARDAVDVLAPVLKSTTSDRWVTAHIIAALACKKLGEPDKAAALLDEIDKTPQRSKAFLSNPSSQDSAVARVLLNEARQAGTP